MKLLSLPAALLAAAIAVPLLLLLYFLKLRRQERKISSTLLWKKAVQDLQVNAPFQKLRKNLLLFLQLLLLAAVLFGLANPVANFTKVPEQSVVILVDASGSMRAAESAGDGRAAGPRLQQAKDAAARFIAELPAESRAMVISFADRARVEASFTSDKRRLKSVVEAIEPTSGPSRVAEALQLAVAYSSSLTEDTSGSVPEAAKQGAADIELFSDGRLADADQQFITRGQMRYYKVGAAADNVGIVAFDVRRDFERPGYLSIFVRVENFGPTNVKSDLSLSLDGRLIPGSGAIREVSLGPAADPASQPAARATDPSTADLMPGQSVVFELQHDAGGVLEVKWHRDDALAIDNTVVAPLDPPRPVRVLAVTARKEVDWYLRRAMGGFDIEAFEIISPADYEAMADSKLQSGGRCSYDLVILDNHDTARLPPGNYLFFGALPRIDGVSRGEEIAGKPVVFGQSSHPLMRSINYDATYVARWKRLKLPPHAQPLLEGEDSVVMALLTDPGHRYVITAFDLLDSDVPLKPAFPILIQNAITFLAGGGLVEAGRLVSPGDTLSLPVPPGAKKLRITRPNGATEDLDVVDRVTIAYARTQDVGSYQAAFDDTDETRIGFAVNLLDRVESNVAPNENLTLGADRVSPVSAEARVNQALWPWAAAAAIAFLLLEWWVYNKRVML